MSAEPESLDPDLREEADLLLERARSRGAQSALLAWFANQTKGKAPSDVPAETVSKPLAEIGRFGMIGDSPAMRALYSMIERLAASDVPVLIHGETGSGKEHVARALHEQGTRATEAFVAVNCAAVAKDLLESELFGHVKGSFTGAHADRDGQFVAAHGGTLFLDEIGDMPLAMQAKLLRALQERQVRPVGSNRQVPADVRVVAASHRDLREMINAQEFREDLYFRLAVVTVEVPPLRDRLEDLPELSRFLLTRAAGVLGRGAPKLTAAALERLAGHSWPGNVRELDNELLRAAALAGDTLGPDDFSDSLGS